MLKSTSVNYVSRKLCYLTHNVTNNNVDSCYDNNFISPESMLESFKTCHHVSLI